MPFLSMPQLSPESKITCVPLSSEASQLRQGVFSTIPDDIEILTHWMHVSLPVGNSKSPLPSGVTSPFANRALYFGLSLFRESITLNSVDDVKSIALLESAVLVMSLLAPRSRSSCTDGTLPDWAQIIKGVTPWISW